MATPCSPGLNCQRFWIVFSAPEMTTVSKPTRKPASAETIDQMTMLGFMEPPREWFAVAAECPTWVTDTRNRQFRQS